MRDVGRVEGASKAESDPGSMDVVGPRTPRREQIWSVSRRRDRVAALLDMQAISDISAVVSDDTFERPIYAGSMIATVKMLKKS